MANKRSTRKQLTQINSIKNQSGLLLPELITRFIIDVCFTVRWWLGMDNIRRDVHLGKTRGFYILFILSTWEWVLLWPRMLIFITKEKKLKLLQDSNTRYQCCVDIDIGILQHRLKNATGAIISSASTLKFCPIPAVNWKRLQRSYFYSYEHSIYLFLLEGTLWCTAQVLWKTEANRLL